MNTRNIKKLICILFCLTLTVCLPHTVYGHEEKDYYGVIIDHELSDFIAKAVIPFANYALDLSHESPGVKSALFLNELSEYATGYEKGFLPDDYKTNKSRGQIHMITLTTTRHIKGFGLWCFDSHSYAVVDDTKVFIGSDTHNIAAKRTSSLPVYKLKEPENLYNYDPTMIALYKVDSVYKFYVRPEILDHFEGKYKRKHPQVFADYDSAEVQIINLASKFDPLLRKCFNDKFIYRIDRKDAHCVQITMIPKRWMAIFEISEYYQVSQNNISSDSKKKRPDIFIHKSLLSDMGELTGDRLTVRVPRNIPTFVKFIDFTKFIFDMENNKRHNAQLINAIKIFLEFKKC